VLLALLLKFLRGRQIRAESGSQFCPNPRLRNANHLQCPSHQTLLHADQLACVDFAGRLCRLRVHLHGARPTRARRKGARLENANRPKPFVEARSRGGRGRIVRVRKQSDREFVKFAVASKWELKEVSTSSRGRTRTAANRRTTPFHRPEDHSDWDKCSCRKSGRATRVCLLSQPLRLHPRV
jgi:hypothetical protein